MNDHDINRLREVSWRRPLTEAEQAGLRTWLAAHPEAQADWQIEAGLNDLLARLPDAAVPSNFTQRVLQAIEREEATRARTRHENWRWWWRVLIPRAAIVLVVSSVSSFAYHRDLLAQRVELAESVAAVADARSLSSPKILGEDFDAIRRLIPTPPPDNALLALLK